MSSLFHTPGTNEAHILLDVEATHIDGCLDAVHKALETSGALADADAAAEVRRQLSRHADLGPDSIENGIVVVHEQCKHPGLDIQVFVRLAKSLDQLTGEDGVPVRYVWVLLSDKPTHPHMATVAEFSKLMRHEGCRTSFDDAGTKEEMDASYNKQLATEISLDHHIPPELQPTGRLFGCFINDIKRRAPIYISDFTDGLNAKSLASFFFLFFACFAPAVAFSGMLSDGTGGALGAMEMVVATALCGTVYALISGQPLTILGSTGPVIIFMTLIYDLCMRMGIPFLPTLAWVGLWTMAMLLVLAFTDACIWIRYFTRFTDDTFAALISIIFIWKAVEYVLKNFSSVEVSNDQALLALVLTLGTYGIGRGFSRLRTSSYALRVVREFFADFGPAIAIILMTGLAIWMSDVKVKTLPVPEEFSTTSGRPWFVNPLEAPVWVWFAAAVPAALMSILLYLDQNITVRLVSNPEFKLKKGSGYHLDLAVVGGLVGVCSMFGLPWMVAATVRSLNHVRSLNKIDVRNGKEVVVGTVENRVTPLLIHIAVGLSLLFLDVLAMVPMAVLYGLFLYMGVASMKGNQLFERLQLWITDPSKYPTTHYLRAVPKGQVHKFTAIQAFCLAVLWVVKSSVVGILFPVFIAMLVPIRFAMNRLFKAEHLALLDAEEVPEDEELREVK